MQATATNAVTAALPTYRCPTRPITQSASDLGASTPIQLKARNADDAFHLAVLIAPPGILVVDVERLDD